MLNLSITPVVNETTNDNIFEVEFGDGSSTSIPDDDGAVRFHGVSLAMAIVSIAVIGLAFLRGICLCRNDCSRARQYTPISPIADEYV
ncbi:unnamed protein product [Allacma fusca]|uniref:Uncharacterized protein n=1 Tax=Allacma fusca TaxID=39272 RepID=A0A8J2PJN7_9HEXA|nr:unnamed protein product [Allacma fusca]